MDLLARLMLQLLCIQEIYFPVLGDVWKVKVLPQMDALTSSCVVIPCTFQYPGERKSSARVRAIWEAKDSTRSNPKYIYHNDVTQVMDSFQTRTRIVGNLGDQNCTLEIDKVQTHDDGPFCFRVELENTDKYSFTDNCVTFQFKENPEKPVLVHDAKAYEGSAYGVTCTVKHTCPTHPPNLTWSRDDAKPVVYHKNNGFGNWEVTSLLTFVPSANDHDEDLSCTAHFWGQRTEVNSMTLNVKQKQNFLHIIVPVIAVVLIALILGGLYKWRRTQDKKEIENLKSSPNRRSLWDRISRRERPEIPERPSRQPHDREPEHPSRQPHNRVSFWNRISYRQQKNSGGRQPPVNHKVNNVDLSSGKCQTNKVSKPPFPSPKKIDKKPVFFPDSQCDFSRHNVGYTEEDDDIPDYENSATMGTSYDNIYANM
ncbi:sialic acid-binding Ig-like lectin 14 isoform X2 [Lepisosteus oculatus]|uniref:sialic acid-binding Ig-like lectin 14 isoform X2 n=1 Tax=Lepisosteus oculatus TaxID=7918 RepID=UPI00371FFCFF